jgi:hypothetical protein
MVESRSYQAGHPEGAIQRGPSCNFSGADGKPPATAANPAAELTKS